MNSPVLLAISGARWSRELVERALENAETGGMLVAVYVVDTGIADYLSSGEADLYPDIREACGKLLLKGYVGVGNEILKAISARGRTRGVDVNTHLVIGRFANAVLDRMAVDEPRVVMTGRPRRQGWGRYSPGEAPASLAGRTGCPLIEV